MKKAYLFLKRQPLIAGAVCFALCVLSIKSIDTGDTYDYQGALLRILLSALCLVTLGLISGTKVIDSADHETGYALKKLAPLLILPALLGVAGVVTSLSRPMVENWPVNFAQGVLMMCSVGVFEELCFRAVMHDALLYQFREKKSVFIWIALISCIVFGAVHVMDSDLGTGLAFAQAALKTATTAMSGFIWLIVYWKTHNIWACAITHALNDLLISISGLLFVPDAATAAEQGYVMDQTVVENGVAINMGFMALGMYIIQFVFCLVVLLFLLKVLRSIDFEEIRREW